MANQLTDSQRTDALAFFKDQLKQIEEINCELEVDFECACADGDFEKVEKLLDTVPYYTKNPDYIKDILEFSEDTLNYVYDDNIKGMVNRDINDPKRKNIEKVFEILRTRPDC